VIQNVLAIAGSLRRASFNRRLVSAAQECAPAGMTIVAYDELRSIPPFDEDLEAAEGGPEAVRSLRRQVARADGLLIATPEYNWSIPGVLKNAIDWLSRPGPEEVLIGKPVAVIGASAGRWGTRLAQANLRQVLTSTESLVMPGPALFVREAQAAFAPSGQLDASTRDQLVGVLAAFSRWMEAVERGSERARRARTDEPHEAERLAASLVPPEPGGC
jgi:chromate reductase, NAD(P)H dehydrogenase (quinone)